MRWLVRREPVRQPRFGENARDVVEWTVHPYLTLASGERAFLEPVASFPGLRAAHAHARRESIRHHNRARKTAAEVLS